jgi:hypothetical protein
MEIEKKLTLKAAAEPRSEWGQLALEAAERIEALKKDIEQMKEEKKVDYWDIAR